MATNIPPPPPGFTILPAERQPDVTVSFPDVPPPPPGFTMNAAPKPRANALDRVNAFATAGNAAMADVLGAPVNTAANVIDLGKAALGYGVSKITGEAPPEALQVNGDRSDVVGSTEWIRKYLAKNAITTPEMSRPDDTASQWIHNATKGVLGLAVGRLPGTGFTGAQRTTEIAKDVTEAAGLGTAPLAIEAMGGDGATQAAGAALASVGRPSVGKIRERDFGPEKMIPEPSKSQTMDMDTPEMRAWATEKLTEAGVPVTKAQRGNQVLASAKRGADTVLGEDPFDARQREAWVGSVLKTAELDGAKRATPDAMQAIKNQVSERYNELHSTVPTIVTTDFITKLEALRTQAKMDMGEGSPDFQRFSNQIDRLYDKTQTAAQQGVGPAIDGKAAQDTRSALGRMEGEQNPTLQHYAGELKETLDDQFDVGATPEQADLMRKTRRQFHRMKQIEDAVKTAPDGLLTPAALMRSVSTIKNRRESVYGQGDQELMDLARAGQIILPERVGNSGTTTRTMDAGKVAVAVTNPGVAVATAGSLLGGRVANRAGANESPKTVREAENARRDARNKAPKPEPKVPSALAGETSDERKRRLRAEQLRK